MSESEESPAQRQARIRRQKREAKINANAQERLDKITQLSGRTPESVRRETTTSTSGAATPTTSTSQRTSPPPTPGSQQSQTPLDPQQAEAQQQFLRALLQGTGQGAGAGAGAGAGTAPGTGADTQNGNAGPNGQPQQGLPNSDDPIQKMLASMMGASGGNGDPNALPDLNFSPDDIAKATGLPSFITKAFMGAQAAPPTPEEVRNTAIWRILHLVFALFAAIYLVFSIDRATATFGESPPAPATFLNPFAVFVMGEVALHTARILLATASGKTGPGFWLQMAKESAGDGALSVFLLGVATWWKGMA